MALAAPPRSTTMLPALTLCQPNTGMRTSSRFITNRASGMKAKAGTMSNMLWCLAASRAGPLGIRSSPRTSSRTPPITLSPQISRRAHCLIPARSAARGRISNGR